MGAFLTWLRFCASLVLVLVAAEKQTNCKGLKQTLGAPCQRLKVLEQGASTSKGKALAANREAQTYFRLLERAKKGAVEALSNLQTFAAVLLGVAYWLRCAALLLPLLALRVRDLAGAIFRFAVSVSATRRGNDLLALAPPVYDGAQIRASNRAGPLTVEIGKSRNRIKPTGRHHTTPDNRKQAEKTNIHNAPRNLLRSQAFTIHEKSRGEKRKRETTTEKPRARPTPKDQRKQVSSRNA
jgi:hypothetical protein